MSGGSGKRIISCSFFTYAVHTCWSVTRGILRLHVAWFVVWVFTQRMQVYFSSIQLYSISFRWYVIYLLKTVTFALLGWHANSSFFLFFLKFGQPKNPNIYSIWCLESKLPGTGRVSIRIRLQMEIIILFDESFSNILQSWGEEGFICMALCHSIAFPVQK